MRRRRYVADRFGMIDSFDVADALRRAERRAIARREQQEQRAEARARRRAFRARWLRLFGAPRLAAPRRGVAS